MFRFLFHFPLLLVVLLQVNVWARNSSEVSPIPVGDALAAIHHRLILPVVHECFDDPSIVLLGGPDLGLVLDSDHITNAQRVLASLIAAHHLLQLQEVGLRPVQPSVYELKRLSHLVSR